MVRGPGHSLEATLNALLLVVYGLGSLYYAINMLAHGLSLGAPMETQRMLELLALAGLGISGSVCIGAGLMFGRLQARGSKLPLAAAIAGLVFSLLTFFFPGLGLSCYLVYLLWQTPVEAQEPAQK